MNKVYLSRRQSKMASLDHPVGDPTGGAAYGEFNDPVTAVVGGSIATGLMGMSAADSAADAQADSAAQANATQRYMYDQTRADNASFLDNGRAANNELSRLLGLSGSGNGYGSLMRNFSQSDMDSDPVYNSGLQFGLDEGRKGLERQSSASGSNLSGATLKALTRFGNDYGSTKANESFNRFQTNQGNQYNRLAGISGTGQTALGQIGAAGQNMANNVSQNQIGMGNARAASAIGRSNAITGAMGQGYNMYQGNQMMNMLQNRLNGFNDGRALGGPNYWETV